MAHYNQNAKYMKQRKNIKCCKGKGQVIYNSRSISITPDFSMETLKLEGPGQMSGKLYETMNAIPNCFVQQNFQSSLNGKQDIS